MSVAALDSTRVHETDTDEPSRDVACVSTNVADACTDRNVRTTSSVPACSIRGQSELGWCRLVQAGVSKVCDYITYISRLCPITTGAGIDSRD